MGTPATDFRPMLCKAEIALAIDKGHFNADHWVMEPKHDGMRAIVMTDEEGSVRVFSRSGLEYTGHLLPDMKDLLEAMIPADSVVDGELAAIKRMVDIEDADGTVNSVPVVDFNRTMRVMGSNEDKARAKQAAAFGGPVSYLVFDIVKWDGAEYATSPWISRRNVLEEWRAEFESVMRPASGIPAVVLNPWFAPKRETYDAFLENKIEGAIMKRAAAQYFEGKRPTQTWVKIKAEKTFDVVVMGFTDGKGKYEGQIGAIVFGAYDEAGKLHRVGQCSGMDDAERKTWSKARDIWSDDAIGKYVIEVKANEMVGSGEFRTPRHPQYVILRQDKTAVECLMEQFRAEER